MQSKQLSNCQQLPPPKTQQTFDTVRESEDKQLDQKDLVSWTLVVIGLLVCLAGFVKGLLSLFEHAVDEDTNEKYLNVDWGGIGIGVVVFVLGLYAIDIGMQLYE